MPRGRVVRAYVGLGANVGDPAGAIAGAVRALAMVPGVRLRGVSRLYATTPVGVLDQPEFRNAAVALEIRASADAAADAIAVLAVLKALERSSGRLDRGHWGPRELDLDLLVFGRARIVVERPAGLRSRDPRKSRSADAPFLIVPHPEAHDRLFVLAPLADLAPALVPPGWSERVETARRRRLLVEGERAVRPIATWDPGTLDWRPLRASAPGVRAGRPPRSSPVTTA